MKKNFLLLCVLLMTNLLWSQTRYGIEHISTNFSGTFPPTGWTIDAQAANWSLSQTANAGGVAPEAKMTWSPQFNAISRLVSPSIDVSGYDNLVFQFKHAIDHYSGAYTVGAATRSNGGEWHVIWSRTGANVVETITVPVNNADVGSSNFQVCVFFSGSSYNINDWFVDDIFLYTPYDRDLSVESIEIAPMIPQGPRDVVVKFKNVGVTPITSFDIQYMVDNGTPVSETVSGITLNSNQVYTHTFTQQWQATPGSHLITVQGNNVNGEGDDDDPSNNILNKNIGVAIGGAPNLPLFEEFTSSTCPPCYSFNTSVFTPFLNSHVGQIAVIKYQMNWPGNGDPYYTAEGGTRRTYYGVNAVPMLFTGGESTQASSAGVNAAFNNQSAKFSFFVINAFSYVTGTIVHANIEVVPYVSVTGVKLRAAVVENETTGNVGSNGETSFHYVMMKMLPNPSGTTVDLEAGVPFQISFTQDMAGTHVEEMDDLSLVVFLQNDATKEVLQSKVVECLTSDARILDFDFVEVETLGVEISVVNNNSADIYVTVAAGTDVTSVTPTITISQGASIVPQPGEDGNYAPMDFTEPIEFVVTSVDGMVSNTYTTHIIFQEPVYPVTFIVSDAITEAPLEGVTITVNDEILTTDEDGKATIDLGNDNYTFTAEKDMYATVEGEFTVNGEGITVNVELQRVEFIITFNVTDKDGEAIEGATISINDETLTTNGQGVATITLTNGEYPYEVSKDEYISVSDVVAVDNEDVDLTITLNPTGIEINKLISASIYPNPTSGHFSIVIPETTGKALVEIYSASGSLIMSNSYNLENSEIKMNIKQLQGIYLVKISLPDGNSVTKKLIVQ